MSKAKDSKKASALMRAAFNSTVSLSPKDETSSDDNSVTKEGNHNETNRSTKETKQVESDSSNPVDDDSNKSKDGDSTKDSTENKDAVENKDTVKDRSTTDDNGSAENKDETSDQGKDDDTGSTNQEGGSNSRARNKNKGTGPKTPKPEKKEDTKSYKDLYEPSLSEGHEGERWTITISNLNNDRLEVLKDLSSKKIVKRNLLDMMISKFFADNVDEIKKDYAAYIRENKSVF